MGRWLEGQPESGLRMLMHIDYHFSEGLDMVMLDNAYTRVQIHQHALGESGLLIVVGLRNAGVPAKSVVGAYICRVC